MADGTYQYIEKPTRRRQPIDYSGLAQPKAMEVRDEALLNRVRGQGFCDLCRKPFERVEAHHIIERSTIRLDVLVNILGLCTRCHVLCQQHYLPQEVQHLLALLRSR